MGREKKSTGKQWPLDQLAENSLNTLIKHKWRNILAPIVSDDSTCIHNEYITFLSRQETSNTVKNVTKRRAFQSDVFTCQADKNEW